MTLDDGVHQFTDDIEIKTTRQEQLQEHTNKTNTNLAEGHLGQPEPPWVNTFLEQGGTIQNTSSSSNQPMTGDTGGPDGPKKRGQKPKHYDALPGPMLVNRESEQHKKDASGDGNGNGDSKERTKPKIRTKQKRDMEALQAPKITQQPASSSLQQHHLHHRSQQHHHQHRHQQANQNLNQHHHHQSKRRSRNIK